MRGSLRILTVRGVPIYVHASWLIAYALISWTLAVGYFPRMLPNVPTSTHWANGLFAALLLFVSVTLHELSHTLVALSRGLAVRGITLHVFGGVSQLEEEPDRPETELLMALAGPFVSFAIAAALWGLTTRGVILGSSGRAIAGYLIVVNLAIALFNMIPGFPLDGGRVLRALLWHWLGSFRRASRIASRVGIAVAVALMAVGVLEIVGGRVIGGLWLILIGLFLRSAAQIDDTRSALREALDGLTVRDVMTRDVVPISPDASIADLVDQFWTHHFTSFPVVANGDVRGMATVYQVRDVPRDRWADVPVRDVMKPLNDTLTAKPDDTVLDALDKATQNGVGRLAILDPGLVGYLSLKDIAHVVALEAPWRDERSTLEEAESSLRRAA